MATIQQNIDRIEQAKLDIKQAIVDKGVAVLDTDRIDTYASKIEEIKVGEEIKNQNIVSNITENKPTTVTYNEGYTGLGEVEIRPTVVYDVSATYNCPWGPEEFIKRYKNGDWKYGEGSGWASGYIYKPELGVIFCAGDPGYSDVFWQRGYLSGEWFPMYNINGNRWIEPTIDELGMEKMNNENIRPVRVDPEWNSYEPFDFFKGKPVENGVDIRTITYNDFYGNSKVKYASYSDGAYRYNRFLDENSNEVYFENPVDMAQSNNPLIEVVRGGYGAGLYPDGTQYYGMILPENTYQLSIGKFGPTFTPMSNNRYNNVSDFLIVTDGKGNYYDAADITYEMITYEHPLAKNIKSMNRVLVYNDLFTPFENLQYINYLEMHNSCNLPSSLRGVGVIVLNKFAPTRLFKGCKYLREVPWFDTTGCRDFTQMFYECESLTKIPDLNMDSATSLSGTFQSSGITEVPEINTSNVTNMSYVLGNTAVTEIPDWDFSNVQRVEYAFYNTKIETVDLTLPKVTDITSTFAYCSNLKTVNINIPNLKGLQMTFRSSTNIESIGSIDASNFTYISNVFGTSQLKKLTNFGGLQNLKIDWSDSGGLRRCPNLTYESLMNVINGLYDFIGNGETGGKTIQLSTSSQSKLSDADIEIATNKGWTITFA